MTLIDLVSKAFVCIAFYDYSAFMWFQMSGVVARLWLILSACDREVCKLTGSQSITSLQATIPVPFRCSTLPDNRMIVVEPSIGGSLTDCLVLTRR